MSSKKVSRRDFLKMGAAVTGASAYLAACAPQAAEPAAAESARLDQWQFHSSGSN